MIYRIDNLKASCDWIFSHERKLQIANLFDTFFVSSSSKKSYFILILQEIVQIFLLIRKNYYLFRITTKLSRDSQMQ